MRKTNEEMLQGLRDLAARLGKDPTAVEVDADKTIPSRSTYASRFGSLSAAKELAGLSNRSRDRYSDEQLIELLTKFSDEHGKAPSQKDCRNINGLPGPNTFKDRFGSWEAALEAAGLERTKLRSNQISDEDLLDDLRDFYNRTGRAPTHEECNDINSQLKSHMVYTRRFGTFLKALDLAGVPRNLLNVSMGETHLLEFIKSIYSGPVLQSYWGLVQKELDIFLPDLSIAIEFDGLYWHSEGKKEKNYHIEKTLLAEKSGIRLIHIFESEWTHKRKIVEERLRSILGVNKNKIFARKCDVKSITRAEAKEFLENTHIQGWANSSVNLGLFYGGELVSVMTFCKSRYNKGYVWELLRFSSKLQVVGGASKLLAHFRNYYTGSIISYSDIRWNTGGVYKSLGFTLLHRSEPNYWYWQNKANPELLSRVKFQKHKLSSVLKDFDPNKTERENMANNGYRRIYDCGNYVFGLE